MSQPSKSTSYFKAAAKVFRLQRTLSRSKGSKDYAAAPTHSSAPCTPVVPSFQHSNGRRLSYNHYHLQSQRQHHYHLSHQSHHHPSHSQTHFRPDHQDSTILSIQRRRTSTSLHPTTEVFLISSAPSASSKHGRRSALGLCPTIAYQSSALHTTHSNLTRSKSMPQRRRKRLSHQVPGMISTHVLEAQAPQVNRSTPTAVLPPMSLSSDLAAASSSQPLKPNGQGAPLAPKDLVQPQVAPVRTNTAAVEQVSTIIAGPTVCPRSQPTTLDTALSSRRPNPNPPTAPTCEQGALKFSRSLASSTRTSSSANATTMPLAASSMSIQSHLSEASILSAAMSASGLPSMNVMMDQVDRSVAMDNEAQLVENAHVGLALVSVVDRQLIAEPCFATIETWV